MRRRLPLVVAIAATVGALILPLAATADEVEEQVEEHWPEEVPTPWFCHWVGPNYVCVPPW